ncbi:MAG: hypothetical protein LBD94_02215 [Rickettsiales bacterium]|jgi:hypothetical protein|nr:hypothetical protein [Rickettsiales bacterium]
MADITNETARGKPSPYLQSQIEAAGKEKFNATNTGKSESWCEKIIGHATEMGNCSACCFRNYRPICMKIICWDNDGAPLYWTTKNTMEINEPDFKELVRSKKTPELLLEKLDNLYLVKIMPDKQKS